MGSSSETGGLCIARWEKGRDLLGRFLLGMMRTLKIRDFAEQHRAVRPVPGGRPAPKRPRTTCTGSNLFNKEETGALLES